MFRIIAILLAALSVMPASSVLAQADTCRVVWNPAYHRIVSADSGLCDTIRIGCPIDVPPIVPGDSFNIPIYLFTDQELEGFLLGFRYNSDFVEITSWSTHDGVVPAWGENQFHSWPDRNMCVVGWRAYDAQTVIAPTEGSSAQLLGKLRMRVLRGAVPHVIDVDTTLAPRIVFEDPLYELMLIPRSHGLVIEPQYVDCGTADIVLDSIAPYACGDVDGSGRINISDAIYLARYIFSGGQAPLDASGGDIDCNSQVNLADAVSMVSYIFGGGSAPCEGPLCQRE